MSAIESGNLNMLEFLLSKGANPNLQDCYGETALDMAWYREYPEIIELLEKYG